MKWPEELNFMKNSRAKQHQSQTSMKGQLTIISGATSGVGLSTAKKIAEAGSNLVLVCRNKSKGEQVRSDIMTRYQVQVDVVLADFSVLSDVRRAAEEILSRYPKIDVLINSVGIHSTKKMYNVDGYEMCLTVNHLSVFLFTELLMERMKASAPSRIIQVNSEGHRFSKVHLKDLHFKKRMYTGLKSYGQSKTAQLLTMLEMVDHLKGSGVTINACHPGAVKTNIGSNNGALYRWFFRNVTSRFLKQPEISGEALYYLASDPALDEVSGKFFNLTIDEIPAKHARDRVMSKKIYDTSLTLVGLK